MSLVRHKTKKRLKLPDSVTNHAPLCGNFGSGYLRHPILCEKCETVVSPARNNQRFCEPCRIIYRKEWRKRWYLNHPNYKKGWLIVYSKRNPEKYAEYMKNQRGSSQIWSDKNKEYKRKYNKMYHSLHREHLMARCREWYYKNKNKKQNKTMGI